jgi:hypothetical protein
VRHGFVKMNKITSKQLFCIKEYINYISKKTTSTSTSYIDTLFNLSIKYTDINNMNKKQATAVISTIKQKNSQNIYKSDPDKKIFKINTNNLKYYFYSQTEDYYIADQVHVNSNKTLRVIGLANCMVVDWDNVDLDTVLNTLQKTNCTFAVYQTFNGYHAYCLSHKFPHWKEESLDVLKQLQCDPIYIQFTKSCGYVVRLSPKDSRNEKFVERYITTVNQDKSPILPELLELVSFKDSLLQQTDIYI